MTTNNPFPQPICETIWNEKYRLITPNPEIQDDNSVQDTWRRIATACAQSVPTIYGAKSDKEVDSKLVSIDMAQLETAYYHALEDFKFLPAGRITAGAGSARNVTLFNCLAGETKVLTDKGLQQIKDLAGQYINVVDGNGQWQNSLFHHHGQQKLAAVVLRGGYNGSKTQVVRATAGHRWITADGEKTTETLVAGDTLVRAIRPVTNDTLDYRQGVIHGLIYGDGTRGPDGAFSIRLCGEKSELSIWFNTDWTSSNPPSSRGDTHWRLTASKTWTDLKQLPYDKVSPDYLVGFLRGWLATDGSVCGRGGYGILTGGADEIEWLRQFGAVSGMEIAWVSDLKSETNYGVRNKPLQNACFHRHTMTPEDFLRTKHQLAFKPDSDFEWKVVFIGDYGSEEDVYCPEVFSTTSFTLHSGIHTGQCFVMGTIPDSINGIYGALKEAALTMQQGGGIGYDFSTIRPKNAPVVGVDADASGPLSFMDCWDTMCKTILSAGSRRGAMMATMRCDHPDIKDFITAKRDAAKLRMFNLSVLISDAFIEAVKNDADWNLHFTNRRGERRVYETVRAKDLWNLIMDNTYRYAEPGVLFIDRINSSNNLWYDEYISATNPCGEQPLPPYGACLLGSLNLPKFVINPFQKNTTLNLKKMRETMRAAVMMLDRVIDISKFPLEAQRAEALRKRRMGIGITGLADLFLMMGVTYGSDESVKMTDDIMKMLAVTAYETSVELAKLYGPCPATETIEQREKLLQSGYMQSMPEELRKEILAHGLRNALLISIAPTGTISLYAGNVSSGIEPIFAPSYNRKVLQKDGSRTVERVEDYAVKIYGEVIGYDDVNQIPHLVTAQTLSPTAHLRVQAAAQKWVDSSISKTINLPEDISFEDFEAVYWEAYEAGCKGCTTYRPNDVTGSVLSVDEPVKAQPAPVVVEAYDPMAPRPETLEGATYKIKAGSDHAMYVTLTYTLEPDGTKRPYEVFMNSKNMDHFAWTVALTRMISAIFRRGDDVSFVVEELKAVFDPRGGSWIKGKYVPSDAAAIGGVIEQFMKDINYIDGGVEIIPEVDQPQKIEKVDLCPNCHSSNMKKEQGCSACLDCGHSKCG